MPGSCLGKVENAATEIQKQQKDKREMLKQLVEYLTSNVLAIIRCRKRRDVHTGRLKWKVKTSMIFIDFTVNISCYH